MTPLKLLSNVCKRYYLKRFVIVIACLVAFALVITLQYIKETELRNSLFANSARSIHLITTVRRNEALTRTVSKQTSSEQKVAVSDPANANVNLKSEIIKRINGTKTQYPVTVNAPYVMENPTLCTSVPDLSVLVIVHSAPDHFDRRQAMRKTWTNDTLYRKLGRVKVLFLLGLVTNPVFQTRLDQEFKDHRDLLQGMFIDAYRNLTHKGVMGYKWITERCRNAKFILKVDDDIVINMFRLFTDYLPQYAMKKKQIFCNHIHPGTMLIIRDKKSKWHVDDNIFKGEKFYPRYCSGFMVLFTSDVIPAIYRSSSLTPFFWVDDVYLYGLAPGNVPGIQYSDLKKGSHELTGPMALKCYRNVSRTCNYLVAGAGRPQIMEEIWNFMSALYNKSESEKKHATKAPLVTTTEVEFEEDTKPTQEIKNEQNKSSSVLKVDGLVKENSPLLGNVLNQLENIAIKQPYLNQ